MRQMVDNCSSVDGENLQYFKEQYTGNRNAQDLTDRLVRENPLQCDWLGITYSQTVHKAVEVRDLVLSRDQGGASHFENLKLRKPSTSVDPAAYDLGRQMHLDLLDETDLDDDLRRGVQDEVDSALCSVYCHPEVSLG